MEKNLKTFMTVSGQSRQSSPIEWEVADSLEEMKSYNQHISEPNFTTFLETLGLCRLQPYSNYNSVQGDFRRTGGKRLRENGSNSIL